MALSSIFSAEKTFLFKLAFCSDAVKAKISRVDDYALQLYIENEFALESSKLRFPSQERTFKNAGSIIAVPFSQIEWAVEQEA